MMHRAVAALLLAACLPAGAATLEVAWLRDGQLHARALSQAGARPLPAADTGARLVPLGSLWKLFVYLYVTESGREAPDYLCRGRVQEEVYCCNPGERIDRDSALVQSCGLFFAPERLGLDTAAWRRHWTERLGQTPAGRFAWLATPAQLTPERLVRLDSLLQALGSIAPAQRAPAEAALLRVVLDGRGAGAVRWFGSSLRVKTFSWHHPGQRARRFGGAAGWLADGTPVWFAGDDASGAIFRDWAPQLAATLPPATGTLDNDSGCVTVDFFSRYPLRSLRGPDGRPARPGALTGRHVAQFSNGNALAFQANGELSLVPDDSGRPTVQGRFGVNDYVARVLDREGGATPPEAAKALAVAARSYLAQNARLVASCQHIADSSATQRVSPNPATPASLAIARWTDRLVVEDVAVRYHRDTPGPDVLAWTGAQAQARAGMRFDAILAHAYPRGALGALGAGQRCERLHRNEDWLARMLPRWERVLRAQPGYERPAQPPLVCALTSGAPYSEQSRNRVFMRPLASREDRITLAHEYLHIGLRHHPSGQDEDHVERLARRLVDLNPENP